MFTLIRIIYIYIYLFFFEGSIALRFAGGLGGMAPFILPSAVLGAAWQLFGPCNEIYQTALSVGEVTK